MTKNRKMIALVLHPAQEDRIEELKQLTGWSQSEIIRQLIDNALVKPAVVSSILTVDQLADA